MDTILNLSWDPVNLSLGNSPWMLDSLQVSIGRSQSGAITAGPRSKNPLEIKIHRFTYLIWRYAQTTNFFTIRKLGSDKYGCWHAA